MRLDKRNHPVNASGQRETLILYCEQYRGLVHRKTTEIHTKWYVPSIHENTVSESKFTLKWSHNMSSTYSFVCPYILLYKSRHFYRYSCHLHIYIYKCIYLYIYSRNQTQRVPGVYTEIAPRESGGRAGLIISDFCNSPHRTKGNAWSHIGLFNVHRKRPLCTTYIILFRYIKGEKKKNRFEQRYVHCSLLSRRNNVFDIYIYIIIWQISWHNRYKSQWCVFGD